MKNVYIYKYIKFLYKCQNMRKYMKKKLFYLFYEFVMM